MFHRGGEYNEGFGSTKVLQLVDKMIQLHCGLESNLD